MDIYIGCDDSGFEMKQEIIRYLSEHNYNYFDCGSGREPSRYPYYAAKVASAVSSGKVSRGILICGSGIGMSIAANKFRGARAAAISDSYSASPAGTTIQTCCASVGSCWANGLCSPSLRLG